MTECTEEQFGKLDLVINDLKNRHISGLEYQIHIGGKVVSSGKTDANGKGKTTENLRIGSKFEIHVKRKQGGYKKVAQGVLYSNSCTATLNSPKIYFEVSTDLDNPIYSVPEIKDTNNARKIADSEFCRVMCEVAKREREFKSPMEFAKKIIDINHPSDGPNELLFLPSHPSHHYSTGVGPVYDMQYVLVGWALDFQSEGAAVLFYGGYSVFGRGLGNLFNGNGFNTNFLDQANGAGLMFGVHGARSYSSFSEFARATCQCQK